MTSKYVSFESAKQALREESLHNEFVLCGKYAKDWIERCKQMLPEIDRLKIWKKKGFGSIFEYAAKLAGMSRYVVEDSLRILRKIEDKPALQEVAKKKGLNAVRPVVGIATVENQWELADKSMTMSKHTLEVYAGERRRQEKADMDNRLESRPGTAGQSENPSVTMAGMELDFEVANELLKLKGQGDWNSLMKELLELRRAKLEAEKPEPVRTDSRAIPTKIERWVVAKTRGQCGYPDCLKPYKILHHTQRWALDHVHDPDKIVPLCTAHERIAHQSLIENEDKPTNEWRVRKEAVWWDLKYSVDQQVMAYRGL